MDDRERDLIKVLAEQGVAFEVRRLQVGDIYFPRSGALVERKIVSDLAASIKDGRWREQRHRLLETGARIFYIIEGGQLSARNIPTETLTSAILNAAVVYEGIRVLRTANVGETAMHLRILEEKLLLRGAPSTGLEAFAVPRSKRQRRGDCTFQLMLMAIPGVSEGISSAIVERFPTIVSLQAQLTSDPVAVANLVPKASRKRVGPAVAKRLVSLLLPSE